jgi:hypothetical protein
MAVLCPHFGRRVQHGNRGAGAASDAPTRKARQGRPTRLGFTGRQSHSWSYETTAAAATASYGGRIQRRAPRSRLWGRARAHRRCKRPVSRLRDHARLSRARRDRPPPNAGEGHPRTRRRDQATGGPCRELTRISHTNRRIGSPNQRKLLCRNDFAQIRGASRCRRSVARNHLILEPCWFDPPLPP